MLKATSGESTLAMWKMYTERMLYNTYLEIGRATFGGAFHQLGNMKVFADFVFKHMQPGAT